MDRRDLLKLGALTVVGAATHATRAAAGKRWAMVVNPSICPANCTDCIRACHNGHNVPNFVNSGLIVNDPTHEIKWIWHEEFVNAFPGQAVEKAGGLVKARPLVLCNHCDHPPCVKVCPTGATFKRPDGIVQMDYHRCIGCRYCVAACPYGARSFNYRDPREGFYHDGYIWLTSYYPTRAQGVVEKCNFCVERLPDGLAPLCVAACKKGGLIFGDMNDPGSPVRKALAGSIAIRRRPELGTEPAVYYLVK